MDNKKNAQPGQALILIALGILGMMGIVGLMVDGGNVFSERRQSQNAADTSAIAAALEMIEDHQGDDGDGMNWLQAATNLSLANGYNNDGTTNIVNIYHPPIADCNGVDGPYTGDNEYVQVMINIAVDTYFAPVLGVDQLNSCVDAIARAKSPYHGEMYNGNAVVSLKPTDCRTVFVHGTASTTIIGGGVFANSAGCFDNNKGAFEQQGNGSIDAPSICSVSQWAVQKPALVTNSGNPQLPTYCAAPVPYPPDFPLPNPNCGTTNATKVGSTITPGNISGNWFTGNINLDPGLYCISGDVTFNAHDTITGHGVTLYFVDGGFHINGKGTFILDAPTSGEFEGLLIYLPMTNASRVIINGNSNSVFTGTILAPASDIQINGTQSADGYDSQIIGYTIDLIGTSDAIIRYNDSNNMDISFEGELELSK